MKCFLKILMLSALFLSAANPASAIVQVQDISLIKTSLFNARRDLTEQILQGTRQIEQIRALYSQIKQAETHLKRFGDPRKVTLTTVTEALNFLQQLNLNRSFEDLIKNVEGQELFTRTSGPVAPRLSKTIVIDGQEVATTDASVLVQEAASHRASEHYQQVRDAALKTRPGLKVEMERTLRQLKSASTTSEIQKLNIVMRSLESQLAANDREIGFAGSGVMATYLRNENEKEIQAKLHVQRQRAALRHSTESDLKLYEISSKRVPFKR
ncbi:MAG: hypothetical protein ACJAQT_000087 [Akkermansiaceae bacterium]|jgi:hypothetical protein